MLRAEHIKSKPYASCLRVLRKLSTCCFWFRGFKRQSFKTENNLHTRYLEVKKQEYTYDSELSNLKRINVPEMPSEKEISKVRDG